MMGLPVKKRNYITRLLCSLRSLWSAQETLELHNIRFDYLQYFFAFPLSMIFINIQDHIWISSIRVYGFPSTTILFVAFAVGAAGMLTFATPENISVISRISSGLTVMGFVPWLFLPEGYAAFICAMIFMAGIGGCLSCSSFSFVFVLNNAERFFGSAFMLLLIGLVELGAPFILLHAAARKGLALILIAGMVICMGLSRKEDYIREGPAGRFDPSVWLALFIFFSYFAIRIMNFYIPAFQQQSAAEVWGVLTLIPVLICILLQAIFKYSMWTMCNVFFISAIASYALWYAQMPKAAYLLAGMDDIGLFVSFYLIGSVTNKFGDFVMHKLLVTLCIPAVALLYVASDLLARTAFADTVPAVVSGVLFVLFLLFSPAFSRRLFFCDWSEEFRRLYMTGGDSGVKQAFETDKERRPSLDDTNLSLREKQVVLLLLRGMTLRQSAAELGLTFSTVSTYSKIIYKKLGINSRSELFMLFGHQTADASAEQRPPS